MKKIRLYQIDLMLDANGLAFMPYDTFKSKGYAIPPASIYQVVFEGNVGTDTLGDIFTMFNISHPPGYKGRSLSVSDIIELYDDVTSEFNFCDSFGYRKVMFDKEQAFPQTHDVLLCIAAEDGSSSGWKFDLQGATKDEIAAFIIKIITDNIGILVDEIVQGSNSINILYGQS